MKLRPLGKSGTKVSEICLGTMQFRWSIKDKQAYKLMDAYTDAGGNFLDTADMYSQWVPGLKGGESETVIGNWMKARRNRNRIVLATKVRCRMWKGPDGEGLGAKHIIKACEDSLRRLKTDRIDLYQSHWSDTKTPIQETLGAFATLARQGKVRMIGCSNYSGRELEESFKKSGPAGIHYTSVQPHYSLLTRKRFENDIHPIVQKEGMAVIPYSPLEGGFLTGKYRREKSLPKSVRAPQIREKWFGGRALDMIDRMTEISNDAGYSILQLALAWVLAHKWITAPIVGANSVSQLKESLAAANIRLEPEIKRELDRLSDQF